MSYPEKTMLQKDRVKKRQNTEWVKNRKKKREKEKEKESTWLRFIMYTLALRKHDYWNHSKISFHVIFCEYFYFDYPTI